MNSFDAKLARVLREFDDEYDELDDEDEFDSEGGERLVGFLDAGGYRVSLTDSHGYHNLSVSDGANAFDREHDTEEFDRVFVAFYNAGHAQFGWPSWEELQRKSMVDYHPDFPWDDEDEALSEMCNIASDLVADTIAKLNGVG